MNTSQKVFVNIIAKRKYASNLNNIKRFKTALRRGKSIMLLYGHSFKIFHVKIEKEYKHNTPAVSLLYPDLYNTGKTTR